MVKQKSHGKDKKKGSQFVIRVEKVERDAFVALCDRLDTSAAREIRRFMRELVAAHSQTTPEPSAENTNAALTDVGDKASEHSHAVLPQADVVGFLDPEKPRKQRASQKRA